MTSTTPPAESEHCLPRTATRVEIPPDPKHPTERSAVGDPRRAQNRHVGVRSSRLLIRARDLVREARPSAARSGVGRVEVAVGAASVYPVPSIEAVE